MGPLRQLTPQSFSTADVNSLRPVTVDDFLVATRRLKPSVGVGELERYEKWNQQFGSFSLASSEVDREK